MINDSQISKLLISSSPEGMLIVDQNGVIISVNESLVKMFGYSDQSEIIGEQIELLVPAKYHKSHKSHRDTYAHHPEKRRMGTETVLYGRRKDNTEFAVEVGLNHLKTDNGLLVSALVSDISERVEMQEELEKLNTKLEDKVEVRTQELENAILELQDANKILEEQFNIIQQAEKDARKSLEKEKELNELKSRFVSMASHEFRTPLSTVLSSNTLIKKYLDDKVTLPENIKEKVDKHISRIQKSVQNLNGILEDLLSLGKLEEGKIIPKRTEISLQELLNEVNEEMNSYLKNEQEILINNDVNQPIFTDPHLLHNILLNLISNASKYSEEGKTITINNSIKDNLLRIEIHDQGIGIPDEDIQHMFGRFFRAKNAINIQGTGLGLNIVKKYVELIGGTINFTSKLNVGSTFILEIDISKDVH